MHKHIVANDKRGTWIRWHQPIAFNSIPIRTQLFLIKGLLSQGLKRFTVFLPHNRPCKFLSNLSANETQGGTSTLGPSANNAKTFIVFTLSHQCSGQPWSTASFGLSFNTEESYSVNAFN